MKILFLAAPHSFEAFEENLEVVTEEFGVHPPIGLAVAAAAARNDGHEVALIDAYAERIDARETARRAREFGPDLIAFRMHSTYRFWQDIEFVRVVKEALGVPVLAGGYHISCYPEESMQRPELDVAYQGHVGPDYTKLLRHLEKDPWSPPPPGIKGVVYRNRKGRVVARKPGPGPASPVHTRAGRDAAFPSRRIASSKRGSRSACPRRTRSSPFPRSRALRTS